MWLKDYQWFSGSVSMLRRSLWHSQGSGTVVAENGEPVGRCIPYSLLGQMGTVSVLMVTSISRFPVKSVKEYSMLDSRLSLFLKEWNEGCDEARRWLSMIIVTDTETLRNLALQVLRQT